MATLVMNPTKHPPTNPIPLLNEPPLVRAPPTAERAVEEDEIRVRAYAKWVAAGRPEGDGVDFWLEAERGLCRGR